MLLRQRWALSIPPCTDRQPLVQDGICPLLPSLNLPFFELPPCFQLTLHSLSLAAWTFSLFQTPHDHSQETTGPFLVRPDNYRSFTSGGRGVTEITGTVRQGLTDARLLSVKNKQHQAVRLVAFIQSLGLLSSPGTASRSCPAVQIVKANRKSGEIGMIEGKGFFFSLLLFLLPPTLVHLLCLLT